MHFRLQTSTSNRMQSAPVEITLQENKPNPRIENCSFPSSYWFLFKGKARHILQSVSQKTVMRLQPTIWLNYAVFTGDIQIPYKNVVSQSLRSTKMQIGHENAPNLATMLIVYKTILYRHFLPPKLSDFMIKRGHLPKFDTSHHNLFPW